MNQSLAAALALVREKRGCLTVAELSAAVHLSSSHLCALFQRHIGLPPVRFLRNTRLEAAKELLDHSSLSVKEIITRTGFRDRSHFIREFKKIYGTTPSRIRATRNLQTQTDADQSLAADATP